MNTTAPLYAERLSPPPSMHLISLLLGAFGFLTVTPFSSVAVAVTVGVVVAVAASVIAVLSSPVVAVVRGGDPADGGGPDALRLRAGDAVIPVEALGEPEVLDADGLRRVMGPGADARAHACHRAWVHGGVLVPVTDPRDATPYWVICTRRPAQLVAALGRR
ncbi:DUF3093 domain-containing protein [Georgenia ruanii]|nr:DUF3093 domain-containing protein [Georgenia ruanii]